MNKKIILIFTRDFSQWLNELLRDEIVVHIPKIWGRGLRDQIVHFNGRASEWWRYEDDYNELTEYMTHKPLDDFIWQEETHKKFRDNVKKLRQYINTEAGNIRDRFSFFREIISLCKIIYPFYTLSVFVPGPWRDKFLSSHGDKSGLVLNTLMKSREDSEGVFKLLDNRMRAWFGPLVESLGYPANYFNILSLDEVDKLLRENKLPDRYILDTRAKGYVFIEGHIVSIDDFDLFLEERKIIYDKQEDVGELKGTVASRGGIIKGRAQVIYTTAEADNFEAGNILVTPMTSPEYVSAMKKASAIITDEGGLTCHAAIVSRELGIPCVIGTKIATKVFKDGDTVEVDATKGVVRKIK